MTDNRCVSCGAIIPEGRQVCYRCMNSKIISRVLAVAVSLTAMAAPAQAQAAGNENMGTLCMDVNYDGVIDGRDASMVLAEYAQTSVGKVAEFSDTQRFIADTNYDGIVDGVDATNILSTYAYNSTHDTPQPVKTVIFKLMCDYGASVSISIDGKFFIEDWYHSVRTDSQGRPENTMYYIDARIYTWNGYRGETGCLLDVVENSDGYTTQVNQYWFEHNRSDIL